MYLYSENDATTELFNINASEASINQETRKLEANHTYYIAVKNPYSFQSVTGSYKISVTEIKDDVADNFDNSQAIILNKKLSYNIEADGDLDFYKFNTTKDDSFYTIELANSEATDSLSATIYSANDVTTNILDFTAYKENKNSKTMKLEPNHTYYIVVKEAYSFESPTGTYKINIKEIKDDVSDTFKDCKKLSLNKKSKYKLNVDGDIDFFKFKTSKKASYTITLSNACGDYIDAILYEEDDITEKISTITVYKNSKNSQSFKLKAKHTYYISVGKGYNFYSTSGAYSITIK